MRLVALLFVLQGALLAFSQGAAADLLPRDQFGNVLCVAGEAGHGGTQRTPDGHADMMSCCSPSCSMFVGTGAAPPVPAGPTGAFAAIEPTGFVSYADVLASVPKSPRTTRGPPATVR